MNEDVLDLEVRRARCCAACARQCAHAEAAARQGVLDGELAEDVRRLPRRSVLEVALPEGVEPSSEVVDAAAANVRVVDSGTMCRHSYILAVLCIKIEEELETADGAGDR